MKVQVLLKDDVEHVGKTGDLVNVTAGFARNFLLPRGLAARVNASTLQQIEALKKRKAIREMELKREFEGVAARLADVHVSIAMRVTETGTLYGAVHDHNIADLIKAKGFDIEPKIIMVDEPIKTLGDHMIAIKLHPEVIAKIKLSVVANDETPITADEMAKAQNQSDEE